jgi:hypothetical protein
VSPAPSPPPLLQGINNDLDAETNLPQVASPVRQTEFIPLGDVAAVAEADAAIDVDADVDDIDDAVAEFGSPFEFPALVPVAELIQPANMLVLFDLLKPTNPPHITDLVWALLMLIPTDKQMLSDMDGDNVEQVRESWAASGAAYQGGGSMMTYKTTVCSTIMRVAGSATSAMRKPQTEKRVRNDEA